MTIEDYMTLPYPVSGRMIKENGQSIFEFKIKTLPGLIVYADSMPDGMSKLMDAKRQWFESQLALNRKIPLPHTVRQPVHVS